LGGHTFLLIFQMPSLIDSMLTTRKVLRQ